MRTLVATSMYPTAERPNFGIFVEDQVRALRSAGVAVDVIRIDPQETRLNYGLKLLPLVRRLRGSAYDVLHTHHTYSLLLLDLARAAARCPAPLVLTNHEGEVLDLARRTRTWHPTSLLRHAVGVKRFAARRADVTIFVSRQLAAALGADLRHEVIPCGVDLELFRPLDRQACRAQLGLPPDAPVLFFPNRPQGKGKRFGLVEAAYRLVQRHRPDAVLHTAGAIAHDAMPVHYNAADVIVQASYYEASPMVVKEALACEVPLVSTDAGDTREVVDGVPHCHVCGDDPTELAARVEQCLGQRARGGRTRLAAQGLGLDQVARRIVSVYEQISRKTRNR